MNHSKKKTPKNLCCCWVLSVFTHILLLSKCSMAGHTKVSPYIHAYIYTYIHLGKRTGIFGFNPWSQEALQLKKYWSTSTADFADFLSHWKDLQAIKDKIWSERKASNFIACREILEGAGLDVFNLLLLCLLLSAARDAGCWGAACEPKPVLVWAGRWWGSDTLPMICMCQVPPTQPGLSPTGTRPEGKQNGSFATPKYGSCHTLGHQPPELTLPPNSWACEMKYQVVFSFL